MSRALSLLALLAFAPPAAAQLPLPFFGDPPKPKAEKPKAEAPPEAEVPDKVYTKPAPKPLPEGEATALSGPIVVVPFEGMVNPGMGEFTISAIEHARREGAQAVLIELNTPGGLVTTTQKMVQAIMASEVPVIVHVAPSGAHAASAGTMITLAAHIAAMAPATRIGAAHPVTGGGKDPEAEGGKHMADKIENDLAAMVEGIAGERGRNVEWAVDAVRRSVSIDARKALEIGVIDLIAETQTELLEALDGRELELRGKKVKLATKGASLQKYEPSWREQFLNFLANPGVAMILGMLGMVGLMIEIYHPGLIIPGLIGGLCILLSLIAFEQLPIDAGGAILALAGIALLIAEMYTPTYGALGILGVIGLTSGLLLLVDPSRPDFAIDPSIRLQLVDVLPIVGAFVGVSLYISFTVFRAQRAQLSTGTEALLGTIGEVLKPVDSQSGMILLDGEYWQARADERIEPATRVVVSGVDGLVVRVRKAEG